MRALSSGVTPRAITAWPFRRHFINQAFSAGCWRRHPDFAWGAEPERVGPSLQSARFPITAFSFTDDEAMTENCTRKLLAAFGHAPSRLIRVAPADLGLQRIGHLGAFKATGTEPLWLRFEAALDNPPAPG